MAKTFAPFWLPESTSHPFCCLLCTFLIPAENLPIQEGCLQILPSNAFFLQQGVETTNPGTKGTAFYREVSHFLQPRHTFAVFQKRLTNAVKEANQQERRFVMQLSIFCQVHIRENTRERVFFRTVQGDFRAKVGSLYIKVVGLICLWSASIDFVNLNQIPTACNQLHTDNLHPPLFSFIFPGQNVGNKIICQKPANIVVVRGFVQQVNPLPEVCMIGLQIDSDSPSACRTLPDIPCCLHNGLHKRNRSRCPSTAFKWRPTRANLSHVDRSAKPMLAQHGNLFDGVVNAMNVIWHYATRTANRCSTVCSCVCNNRGAADDVGIMQQVEKHFRPSFAAKLFFPPARIYASIFKLFCRSACNTLVLLFRCCRLI